MAQEQDPKVTVFIGESLPRLRQRFASLRAVIFGSRARGDALSTSDLDVILVSPTFRSIPFLRRAVAVLEALDYPAGLELLCYTPEEFAAKRDEYGIVRVALEEGISVS
jgi:predicted nucleotidyltransferase